MDTITKQSTIAPKAAVKAPTQKRLVTSFRDLKTWQSAYDLAVAIHRQCELFPEPNYGFASRMSLVVTEACTYIAEGFERKKASERSVCYQMADDALIRLENQLSIAEGVAYLAPVTAQDLARRCRLTRHILASLQKINEEWAMKQAARMQHPVSVS